MSNASHVEFASRPVNLQDGVRRETPLHHVAFDNAEHVGVVAQELAFCAHVTLRGSAEDSAFLFGTEKALGVALPTTPLMSTKKDDLTIHWVSPDEWVIVSVSRSAEEIERGLRAELTGHFSVVDVSGGQTLLSIRGESALLVMKKSCGYDVEGNLPVGKTVTSHFAKATVLLHKADDDEFWVIIRRSFADYGWRWLVDAAQEYGLQVVEA